MGKSIISVTDAAKEQILAALAQKPETSLLRVVATTNGTSQFAYNMSLIGEKEKGSEDVLADVVGLQIVMDPKSAEYLKGATIEFEDGIVRNGFTFDNPNQPEIPKIGDGPRPDLTGVVAERVQQLLDTELNPAVASHGGMIQFMGVRDNKAYLSFGGGCHGCGQVDVTLKQGVEARIREVVPEIEEVVDTTDHATGENPYYA